jgi:uncharacterized membrane protein YfcA
VTLKNKLMLPVALFAIIGGAMGPKLLTEHPEAAAPYYFVMGIAVALLLIFRPDPPQ